MPKQCCFIIMPFSKTTAQHTQEYWTKHFELFLKPLIDEVPELEARRSKPLHGDILRQIITDLVTAPILVADLTDHNYNVYWELGVRQSFKHCTIIIAEKGTRLPFDISKQSTLYYFPKNHIENERFREEFKNAIKDCLTNPNKPDSHVLETLSGRGSIYEIIRRDEAIRRVEAILSEYKNNIYVLNQTIKLVRENQENPATRRYSTGRFLSSAIELLTTNRYLDEPDTLYDITEKYLGEIIRLNPQLDSWQGAPGSFEKWFLEVEPTYRKDFVKFKAAIDKIKQDLGKRF